MALERLTPRGLFKPAAYSQVVVALGRRLVFISGQVSMDAEGKVVGEGDLAVQAGQVYANLRAALEGAGARLSDVAKQTTYVVGYRSDMLPVIGAARAAAFGTSELPASTLVGVQALAQPGYLIEVEAIAVID